MEFMKYLKRIQNTEHLLCSQEHFGGNIYIINFYSVQVKLFLK